MQCQTSIQVIARGDEAAPNWDAAVLHFADCRTCQEDFRRDELLDRQLAALTRDVAVPHGLQGRIVAALEGLTESATDPRQEMAPPAQAVPAKRPATQPAQPRRFSRRRILVAAGVACLVVAGIGYFVWDGSQKLTADQLKIIAQSPPDQHTLPPFTGFSIRNLLPPLRETQIGQTLGDLPPQRFMIGRHAVAAYFFNISVDHQTVFNGWLFAVPRRSVSDSPEAEGFSAASVDFSQPYPVCMWREGDLVYVCCLTEGGDLFRLFPAQQVM